MNTKKYIILFLLYCLALSFGYAEIGEEDRLVNKSEHRFTNSLINESSPYLQQHAHNPVNWYPWGDQALNKAKRENKLIIISIGYAACHWCHVMEEESFEDEDVAKFMNDNFISIKVDREERPDIDNIYMEAVQLISGRGGWPLNCIALPDGRPIYGGTYFPKENWLAMLSQILKFVEGNPEKTEEQASALTTGINRSMIVVENSEIPEFTLNDLDSLYKQWEEQMDHQNGGLQGSPKFPMANSFNFLLLYGYLSGNESSLKYVENSLLQMAYGGIYDQIGGGFARYSTDKKWKVPHFEKMLYDNAQLVSVYSNAFQLTKNPLYKRIVDETLTFIERELSNGKGGFYSSLDADSEGEEGKYYVWTNDELKKILKNEDEDIFQYYSIIESGNWENQNNILHIQRDIEEPAELQKIKRILLNEREKRIKPPLDDKILTSWNSLMIKAYVDAYIATSYEGYLKKALEAAKFLLKEVRSEDSRLNRVYKGGKSTINGFIDDYAFTIEAFISLYEATFDEIWLQESKTMTEYTLEHFYNDDNGMFYYTSDLDPPLIARKIDILDNVISSSNSQMAKNLYVLGQYFYSENYIKKAKRMLKNVKTSISRGAPYFSNWSILMAWMVSEPYEIAIIGDQFKEIKEEFNKYYLPNVFFSGGKNEGNLELLKYKHVKGQTTIYVCQDKMCKNPVLTVHKALGQLMQ